MKINTDFIRDSYNNPDVVSFYSDAVNTIGLWESEKIIIEKYSNNDKNSNILDIGCGAGRTTFGLYKLGYHNIIGLDLSSAMIKQARNIADQKKINITFLIKDTVDIPFENDFFNIVVFSFNGIMQIPQKKNRIKVMKEVKRVLKQDGYFIFTTHDRKRSRFYKFWKDEQKAWEKNLRNPEFYEFGDIYIGMQGVMSFLHVPDKAEVVECINLAGLNLIKEAWRSDIFLEKKKVKDFAADSRFWITKK